MNPISKGLSWKYQKNKPLIDAFVFRNAPEFVYKANPKQLEGEIPVFTFHSALPDWFEEQCQHLAENGYKTLSADGLLKALTLKDFNLKKTIHLTFDDGLKHVWTVAYPLLKKYKLKATCFILPGCIPENDNSVRPTLEEYWKGQASLDEILSLGGPDSALATWPEIKMMHESGVIDFQSHTMYHALVFTSNNIFDFINPKYNTHFYSNTHVPIYSVSGKDVISRELLMGMPVYWAKPRMSAERRFFDDEEIRNRCIEFVNSEGGGEFFQMKNWKKILCNLISECKKASIINERYETAEERDKVVFDELLKSREIMEDKLTGKKVTHLCYPWFEAEDFAVSISKKAGYETNYFGSIKGRSTNHPGDDPFKIVRIDDIFLQRLPGKGRKSVKEIFLKLFEMRKMPKLLNLDTKKSYDCVKNDKHFTHTG